VSTWTAEFHGSITVKADTEAEARDEVEIELGLLGTPFYEIVSIEEVDD